MKTIKHLSHPNNLKDAFSLYILNLFVLPFLFMIIPFFYYGFSWRTWYADLIMESLFLGAFVYMVFIWIAFIKHIASKKYWPVFLGTMVQFILGLFSVDIRLLSPLFSILANLRFAHQYLADTMLLRLVSQQHEPILYALTCILLADGIIAYTFKRYHP